MVVALGLNARGLLFVVGTGYVGTCSYLPSQIESKVYEGSY